jgi:type IV pilus assembly protein PilA
MAQPVVYCAHAILIELLIVVAILGILAAVIIPNVATFMATGRLNAARTEAENVKTAALAYFADHGGVAGATHDGWPLTSADLVSGSYVSAAPNGVYAFSDNGTILTAGTSAPTGTTFTWNQPGQTWLK